MRILPYGVTVTGGAATDARTLFEIGSITKTMTAALFVSAESDGKVALDDPVRMYLPPKVKVPAYAGTEITCRQILAHISGLPRMPDNFETWPGFAFDNPFAHYTPEALYDFLNHHTLVRSPGSLFEYSNLAYGVLGHALSLRLGVSYEDAVIARIAGPLGMSDTRITLDADRFARFAQGHSNVGAPVSPWDLAVMEGGGGLRSSASDMVAYLAAALGHGPPGPVASIARGFEPQVAISGAEVGLSWFLAPLGATGRTVVFHDGATGGYTSYLGFVREEDRGVVVLANQSGPLTPVGEAILQALIAQ